MFISESQSVPIGADVKLNCWSKGVPAADVTWIRNGKVLVKGSRTAALELKNVSQLDEGVYTCQANNSQNDTDVATANVDVAGWYWIFAFLGITSR